MRLKIWIVAILALSLMVYQQTVIFSLNKSILNQEASCKASLDYIKHVCTMLLNAKPVHEDCE